MKISQVILIELPRKRIIQTGLVDDGSVRSIEQIENSYPSNIGCTRLISKPILDQASH